MAEYYDGREMWIDHKSRYGMAEAIGMCNRYLDMQANNNSNSEELQFCRELYAAMREDMTAGLSIEELAKNQPDIGQEVAGYTIRLSVLLSDDRGLAFGENPNAVAPFATWQFKQENGARDYFWGHYFQRDSSARTDYYQRIHDKLENGASIVDLTPDISAFYDKASLIAAWEKLHDIPTIDRITYWYGDYGMDAPKYERRDEIGERYDQIIAAGHPLLGGPVASYIESERQSAACAESIDAAITDRHTKLYDIRAKGPHPVTVDGYNLEAAVRDVIAEHGADRTAWVLANDIRQKRYHGALSYENRQWAQAFPIPVEYGPSYTLRTPEFILDAFVGEARKIFDSDYLRAAEIGAEQNYNMLDGQINNTGFPKADLTDGQTHEEIMELAPETLIEEKPSVLDQIREARSSEPPRGPQKLLRDYGEREL